PVNRCRCTATSLRRCPRRSTCSPPLQQLLQLVRLVSSQPWPPVIRQSLEHRQFRGRAEFRLGSEGTHRSQRPKLMILSHYDRRPNLFAERGSSQGATRCHRK